MRYGAEYYQHLATSIDQKNLYINASTELIQRFEAAHLILREILGSRPEGIGRQFDSITEGLALEKLFAAVAIKQSLSAVSAYSFVEVC